MKTGIILVTLGGPRGLEEVPEFIKNFLGRELPAPAMRAIVERYRLIGGSSPLTRITDDQAKRLHEILGEEYLCLSAFRYCRPSIEDAIETMVSAGVERMTFLLLSPFYTTATTGNYIDRATAYLKKAAVALPVRFIHSWHRDPLFIASWVERIKNESFDRRAFYLFSAHSLPLSHADEPYQRQVEETVALVAAGADIAHHALAWQSIPDNASGPWITPRVEENIDAVAAGGFQSLVQVPIGFTADHVETLYDIDIIHRRYALEKGLDFRRISSPNADPAFILALKEIVKKQS